MSRKYDLLDTLKECLGNESLISNLMQAMSEDEMNANLEHIANMYDIEVN